MHGRASICDGYVTGDVTGYVRPNLTVGRWWYISNGEDKSVPHDDSDADAPQEGDDITADDEAVVACPYCGESVAIALDPGGGAIQDYVEDCNVCCQPWRVHVRWRRNGRAEVRLDTTDG